MHQFQKALVKTLESLGVSQIDLAHLLDSDPRWIKEITTNPRWQPKLDTLFKICYKLDIDIKTFMNLAEFGFTLNISLFNRRMNDPNLQSVLARSTASQKQLILHALPRHISKTFKELRLENGMSQKQLESITQFSVNSISLREGERYQNYPTITTVQSYCTAFGISLSAFVSRVLSLVNLDEHFIYPGGSSIVTFGY